MILTAGTADLRSLDATDYAGLNETRNELYSLLDYIFEECANCVVLVGDIPPVVDFGWPPTPRQRQALQFNAMISEVVNKQQSIHTFKRDRLHKRHVSKVHFTPAGGDIYNESDNGNGYPTNNGYHKMAYDIHERIVDAKSFAWIQEPIDMTLFSDQMHMPLVPIGGTSHGISQAVLNS